MGNKKCILAVDLGGTSVKSALISLNGHYIKETFMTRNLNSMGARDEILKPIISLLKVEFKEAKYRKLKIIAIGMAVPGPFNLEDGVSLMKHKFSSIYGLNLREIIIQSLGRKIPIIFKLDSWAFLIGEYWRGIARDYERIIGITIGMGLGSAFMVKGHIVTEGEGIPSNGWIWNIPYGDGILEDRVSRRGIVEKYRELTGNEMDVKEIALKAFSGDEAALLVFKEIGLILGECLKPIALKFKPECIVFGGQISKSFNLFKDSFIKKLGEIKSLKKVSHAMNIDLAPLYGITKMTIEEIIV